jgi:tetratricopeptide (TPR) repeat protein
MYTAALLFALSLMQQQPVTKASEPVVPLFNNLGTYHHAISTKVPTAQAYFDQGVRLAYGFNHAEAVRAFTEAARQDPKCAICWWGVAYSYGPNINLPMDEPSGKAAWDAMQKANALVINASSRERAYINALNKRYNPNPGMSREKLDSAYATAMWAVSEQYANDPDAAALAAEAAMDLRPWNYWKPDDTPYPGTPRIINTLEGILKSNPNHPGACHFYIHAIEATKNASKAVPCAEKLASLMPGAGHLVHMPAHIYIRVGRWNDAIEANKHAVHEDQQYIADQKPNSFYPVMYYPHNHHFLAFASTMAGRSAMAIEHARATRDVVPADVAAAVPPLQPFIAYPALTLVTFAKWDDVIAEKEPPANMPIATALDAYAKGVAHAAKGHNDVAQTYLDKLSAIAKATNESAGTLDKVLDIAQHSLMGEMAYRSNDLAGAEQHFRVAYNFNQSLNYIEPPDWYYPVQHSLGAVLLDQGKALEAEKLYREDLQRFPNNVWSLKGLALALHAQNRHEDAAKVEAWLETASSQADVKLVKSRF